MPDDEPQLSEQTKAEMEFGRKKAAENAAALEKAERMRVAETTAQNILVNDHEADAAVEEAVAQLPPEKRKRPQGG